MGFLDSIGLGSVAKVLDVGGLVKNVVDGVLPHQLASVGDFAGAVVDFKTGNIGAALQHAMETVKDLPQLARGQQPAAGNAGTKLNLWPSLPHEPPPPPLASRQGKAFDWNDMLAAMKALTAALNKQGTPGTPAPAAPATPSTAPGGASSSDSASSAGSSPRPLSRRAATLEWMHSMGAGTWRGGPPATNWRGQPPASAPAHSDRAPASSAQTASAVDRAATAVKDAAAAVKGAATSPAANTSAPAAPSTSAEKPPASDSQPTNAKTDKGKTDSAKTDNAKTDNAKTSTGQTISSLAQLNGMSDAAIRDAVINGRISPDLLKDQGAMMVLQQRMQAIAEMNNLMTAMMRAIHDMQMAIVQNIRI